MQVQSIDVTDYSSGSQYVYTDQSGTWQSIKAVDGTTNGNGDGGDSGSDGESGNEPDSGSPAVTEGPSVITDPILSTGMATATVDRPTGYPWVPKPTDTQDTGSPVTSYPGLPSDWTVTDTGRVLPPNTASVSELTPLFFFWSRV
jgi:hypothetical protein